MFWTGIFMDGEWLDHDDPRVNDIWRDRITGNQIPVSQGHPEPEAASIAACRAILGEDAEYIEAASLYDEDEYGCMAARMAYGAPKDLGMHDR